MTSGGPVTNCGHCGANLSVEDMRQPTCRFCGTVLAHYARAAEKVAVVQALLGDANRNGIPDALEGMVAPGMVPPYGASPWGGAPGMPPGGPVVTASSAVVISGGVPVLTHGGVPMGPPPMGGPVVMAGGAHQTVARAQRNVMLLVLVLVAVGILVPLGGAIAWFVLAG